AVSERGGDRLVVRAPKCGHGGLSVGPDLGFMHVTARLEDADHRPVAVPEADLGTDTQAGELLCCLLAHDYLTYARFEAPPADHLELVADREGRRLHTTKRHIVGVCLALARQ